MNRRWKSVNSAASFDYPADHQKTPIIRAVLPLACWGEHCLWAIWLFAVSSSMANGRCSDYAEIAATISISIYHQSGSDRIIPIVPDIIKVSWQHHCNPVMIRQFELNLWAFPAHHCCFNRCESRTTRTYAQMANHPSNCLLLLIPANWMRGIDSCFRLTTDVEIILITEKLIGQADDDVKWISWAFICSLELLQHHLVHLVYFI